MFKPVYDPYLRQVGYDPEDWCLNPNQEIDPHYSSEYVKSLPAMLLKQSGGAQESHPSAPWEGLMGSSGRWGQRR
jgi:hypothetical protein